MPEVSGVSQWAAQPCFIGTYKAHLSFALRLYRLDSKRSGSYFKHFFNTYCPLGQGILPVWEERFFLRTEKSGTCCPHPRKVFPKPPFCPLVTLENSFFLRRAVASAVCAKDQAGSGVRGAGPHSPRTSSPFSGCQAASPSPAMDKTGWRRYQEGSLIPGQPHRPLERDKRQEPLPRPPTQGAALSPPLQSPASGGRDLGEPGCGWCVLPGALPGGTPPARCLSSAASPGDR